MASFEPQNSEISPQILVSPRNTDTSSNDQMKLNFEFKLDFYNQKLSLWEPIIEKWSPTIDLIRSSFHLVV